MSVSNPFYKVALCKNWTHAAPTCSYGDRCNFAHGEEELRYYQAKQAERNL